MYLKIITSQIGAILVVQSMNISPPKTVNADDVFNYLIQRKCSQVAYEFKTLIDTDSFPPQNRENSLERTPQSLSNNSHRDSIVRRQIFTVPRNKHIIALAPKNPAENICMSDNEEDSGEVATKALTAAPWSKTAMWTAVWLSQKHVNPDSIFGCGIKGVSSSELYGDAPNLAPERLKRIMDRGVRGSSAKWEGGHKLRRVDIDSYAKINEQYLNLHRKVWWSPEVPIANKSTANTAHQPLSQATQGVNKKFGEILGASTRKKRMTMENQPSINHVQQLHHPYKSQNGCNSAIVGSLATLGADSHQMPSEKHIKNQMISPVCNSEVRSYHIDDRFVSPGKHQMEVLTSIIQPVEDIGMLVSDGE